MKKSKQRFSTTVPYKPDLDRELKDPEFRAGYELELRKLEMALALIRLRKQKKMSQAALAKKVGTSQSAVARVEAGRANVTLHSFLKIAVALGVRFTPTAA